MKKLIVLLGIVVLVAAMANPVLAQFLRSGYRPLMTGDDPELESADLTKGKPVRLSMRHSKIDNGTVQQFQMRGPQKKPSDIFIGEPQALDERMAESMDNIFAMSFANDLAQFSLAREGENTEKTEMKLLEARLSQGSIYHAMADADADAVYKELEKPSQDVDVDLILNIISKPYPSVREHYEEALNA